MAFTSSIFILFLIIVLLVYYLVPAKGQWIILLAASYAFYLYASIPAVLFLLFSTAITFVTARKIQQIKNEQNTGKPAGEPDVQGEAGRLAEDVKTTTAEAKAKSRPYMLLGLLGDLGVLAVLKYSNFILQNVGTLFRADVPVLRLLLPLGISYYTFQTVGYLLDVYWGRTAAERNPAKYALFVSFFPQIVQGPIGRYGKLIGQLTSPHPFAGKNFRYGLWRILWGVFKVLLLSGWAGIYREAIFANPENYAGIAVFGVLLYSVELYGNFSGGIDITIGIAQLFGITLDENFRQPFFATSISDFWRRWHITLGTWMKDYVMYPLNFSKTMNRFGMWCRKKFGRKRGRLLPICLSSIIVFFLVGIWHEASWNYIGWGLYNGIIIAFSSLMAEPYRKAKEKLHIADTAKGWHLFMILRTFVLINLSWYFDCVTHAKTAFRMIGWSFTKFQPSQFLQISSGKLGTAYTPYALLTLGLGIVLLFIISVLRERGTGIRDSLSRLALPAQIAVGLAFLFCIVSFSPMAAAGGFIYAQF